MKVNPTTGSSELTTFTDMLLYQAETGRDHVLMGKTERSTTVLTKLAPEIIFPSHYPHSPFFLRAVYPRWPYF